MRMYLLVAALTAFSCFVHPARAADGNGGTPYDSAPEEGADEGFLRLREGLDRRLARRRPAEPEPDGNGDEGFQKLRGRLERHLSETREREQEREHEQARREREANACSHVYAGMTFEIEDTSLQGKFNSFFMWGKAKRTFEVMGFNPETRRAALRDELGYRYEWDCSEVPRP